MVTLTDSARDYMKKVVNDGKSKYVYLSVKGGGCSGFQYDWSLTEMKGFGPTIDDILCIDDMAEMGGSFLKVINPNATASCGCGESFAV